MTYVLVMAAEAVPVDGSSNAVAFSFGAVLLSLLAAAVPIALLVGLAVMVVRVRRYGERLEQVEARLAAVEGRQAVGP